MKLFPKILLKKTILSQIKEWVKILSVTTVAQIIVQVTGLVSGILVIRLLSTDEYALYTLANTMLGTMVILADGGISKGVMAQSSKVWKEKSKFGEVIVTGFKLRNKFAIIGLLIGIPILIYLLQKNQASWLVSFFIVLALIPAFISTLSNSLLVIGPKLHQDIIPLQKNQIGVNLGRLLFLTLMLFIFPFAYIAIVASSIPQILGNLRLRKIVAKHVDFTQKPSALARKDILKIVKRVFPEALYYSFSGQITIWLLSILGTTTSIAQIGALGRISLVLGIIPMVFITIITPRFARLVENFSLLLKWYFTLMVLLILVFSFMVLLVYLFSNEVLWVLGGNYANLNYEIVLLIIGTSLTTVAGLMYGMSSVRGWIINPILSISISILTLIIGVFIVNVSSLKGVLVLNIIIGLSQLITNSSYGFYEIFKLRQIKNLNI